MHLKASKCLTVAVLDVSFSYPVVSVRCSISSKPNQMSPVLMRVHGAESRRIALALWCRRSICSWTASVSLLYGRLAAFCRVLGLAGLPYQSPLAAAL